MKDSEFTAYDRPGDRLQRIGASVFRVPRKDELPDLVAHVVRLRPDLHETNPAMARERAQKFPAAEFLRDGE